MARQPRLFLLLSGAAFFKLSLGADVTSLLLATFQIAPVWLIARPLLAFVTSTHIGTEVW